MYSNLTKNQKNQESFHNGLLARHLVPASDPTLMPVDQTFATLWATKHPMITPTNPLPGNAVDLSYSRPAWTTLLSDQATAVQELTQSAVLPIQVSDDTTLFDTPVQVSQLQFPDNTIQSSAWTASHASEVARISEISNLSIEVSPLPSQLTEWVDESGDMQRDVTHMSTVEFDPETYLQRFTDVSTSIHTTRTTQQSFTDDFGGVSELVVTKDAVQSVADTVASDIAPIPTQLTALDASIASYSAFLPDLEDVADAPANLSWISDQIQVDASTTQVQSMHVVMDTSTNSRYSGVSLVRTIPGDPKPTVLYMTAYSDNQTDYTTFLPQPLLLNHAICGPLGPASSFDLTKPLVMTNPAGTRGIRLPMLESDTTTQTELWSNLNVSGGSMKTAACSVAGNTIMQQGINLAWDLVPDVKSASIASGTCTLNWNEGPVWAVSGVGTGNFGIQVQNFPSDTTKIYSLRLLYDSSGGYGNTMTIVTSDGQRLGSSLTINDTIGNRFIDQTIDIVRTIPGGNSMAMSELTLYSDVVLPGTVWTSQTSAENKPWMAVAYGNGLFVAVSSSSGIMTSPDSITWTSQASSINGNSIIYANNMFISFTSTGNNDYRTSLDGINWTNPSSSGVSSRNAVAFGNNTFVAVGDGDPTGTTSIVRTDTTLQSWTKTTISMTVNGSGVSLSYKFKSIAFGNNQFVAVADSGVNLNTKAYRSIASSNNGSTWTILQTPNAGWKSIAFGNNVFMAVSSTGFMSRTSGNWSALTNVNRYGAAVTFAKGVFVSIGSDGVLVSPDAVTYQTYSPSPSTFNWGATTSITYGNGIFVAVCSYSTGTNDRVITSKIPIPPDPVFGNLVTIE